MEAKLNTVNVFLESERLFITCTYMKIDRCKRVSESPKGLTVSPKIKVFILVLATGSPSVNCWKIYNIYTFSSKTSGYHG